MNRLLAASLLLLTAPHGFGQATPSPSVSPETMVIATVLGRNITMKEAAKLNGIIFGTLLEKYATENKIVPTRDELDAFLVGMDEGEKRHLADLEARQASLTQDLQSTSLTEQQRKQKTSSLETVGTSLRGLRPFMEQESKEKEQMHPMKLGIAKQVVTKWKVNKALYDQYGGRVIFQQAGDEPMDAYQAFLKDEERKGSFQIVDGKCKESFWEHFSVGNTSIYSKEEADKAMNTPWWMRKAADHP